MKTKPYTDKELCEIAAGLAWLRAELDALRAVAGAAQLVRDIVEVEGHITEDERAIDVLADALDAYDALDGAEQHGNYAFAPQLASVEGGGGGDRPDLP